MMIIMLIVYAKSNEVTILSNKNYLEINGRKRQSRQSRQGIGQEAVDGKSQKRFWGYSDQRSSAQTGQTRRSQEDISSHPSARQDIHRRLPRKSGQRQSHFRWTQQESNHLGHGRRLRPQEERPSSLRLRLMIAPFIQPFTSLYWHHSLRLLITAYFLFLQRYLHNKVKTIIFILSYTYKSQDKCPPNQTWPQLCSLAMNCKLYDFWPLMKPAFSWTFDCSGFQAYCLDYSIPIYSCFQENLLDFLWCVKACL